MGRAVLAGLLAAGALAGLADGLRAGDGAADLTPAAKRGLMQAVIVEKGPEIDGTLKSPAWQACPPLVLGECTSDKPGRQAPPAPPPPLYEQGREVGGVIVYRRFDEITVPEERDGLNKSIGRSTSRRSGRSRRPARGRLSGAACSASAIPSRGPRTTAGTSSPPCASTTSGCAATKASGPISGGGRSTRI